MTKKTSKKNLHKERLKLRKLVTSYAKLLERNSVDQKVPSCLNDWLKSCTIPASTQSSSKRNRAVEPTSLPPTLKLFSRCEKDYHLIDCSTEFLNTATLKVLLKLSQSSAILTVAFDVDTTLLEPRLDGSLATPPLLARVRTFKPSQSP